MPKMSFRPVGAVVLGFAALLLALDLSAGLAAGSRPAAATADGGAVTCSQCWGG
jgi:hypothetical protein